MYADYADYTAKGGLKKLMKLRKDQICQLYIDNLNEGKETSSVNMSSEPALVNDMENDDKVIDPSPTQVIHKSDDESDSQTVFDFSTDLRNKSKFHSESKSLPENFSRDDYSPSMRRDDEYSFVGSGKKKIIFS